MSDDGRSAVVLILMLGNVFSPRWADARAKSQGVRSIDFSAVNVAVHGPSSTRWAMTERSAPHVMRSQAGVAIGSTDMHWEGDTLVAQVDERTAPWGRRLRGTIRFRPEVHTDIVVDLDGRGRHRWSPLAPRGRIEVAFDEPFLRFEGHGYLDANAGDEPLEAAFRSWTWSRVSTEDQIALAYDVELTDGSRAARGVRIGRAGDTATFDGGTRRSLGPTLWGLPREVRAEEGAPVRLVRTLEDGPFYARSVVETSLGGRPASGMHETVSLDRFASRWVRFLVPFRMRVEDDR